MNDNCYHINFQTWDKLAHAYSERFMDFGLYNDSYDSFCGYLPKAGARIFEIGCGPGNIARYLLRQRPDFKISATDVSPQMIKLAAQLNPGVDFEVMDCREISAIGKTFDAVICGFCLPYISPDDSEKLIKDSAHLLAPDGIFYLSTIEGDASRSGFETGSGGDRVYVYYYEAAFLKAAFRQNGFEVMDETRKPYPAKNGKTDTHLIFIARKK